MSEFTPGPWFEDEAVAPQFMAQCLLDNPTWVAIEDTADDGGHVAYCAPGNAPIIAAAPDMYAALVDMIDMMGPLEDVEMIRRKQVALKALAKARGQ